MKKLTTLKWDVSPSLSKYQMIEVIKTPSIEMNLKGIIITKTWKKIKKKITVRSNQMTKPNQVLSTVARTKRRYPRKIMRSVSE
jgi:hypothetical protein